MSRRAAPDPEGVDRPELVALLSLPLTGVSARDVAGAKIGRRGDEMGPMRRCELVFAPANSEVN